MNVIERLRKYAGLNKDEDRCPPSPNITVREAIEIADYLADQEVNLKARLRNIVFEKRYDGESIVDLTRDVSEAVREKYNPAMASVPKDKYGFQKGTFVVRIEWEPEGGIQ